LLQAQLLLPLGSSPIQPSLAFTDLDTVRDAGLFTPGFGEFDQLFLRDGLRIDGTGVLGTDATRSGELLTTVTKGRGALSLGGYHYETKGFRENNDLKHEIYNVLGQFELTEGVNLQAEYRHRDTRSGDRRLFFDLDNFEDALHRSIEEDVFRLGAHLSPTPNADLLLSAIYSHRDDDTDQEVVGGSVTNADRASVGQAEMQYIGKFGPANLVVGAGRAIADGEETRRQVFLPQTIDGGFEIPGSESDTQNSANVTANDVYAITTLPLTSFFDLSLRIGYDDVDLDDRGSEKGRSMSALTPGVGAVWRPTSATQFRAALGRSLLASISSSMTSTAHEQINLT
jgi:hypothetical protein